jgi:hypothetical protein
LGVTEAKRALLESGGHSFHEALALAKADELQKSWPTQVAEAVKALNSISALELDA